MKRIFFTTALIILLTPAAAFAGACPTRANSLEAFAGCMVPLRGTIGTASVYSSGQYDESARKLMQAMARGSATPPQVIPATVGAYHSIGYYSPYFRLASYYYSGLGLSNVSYHNPYYYGLRR